MPEAARAAAASTALAGARGLHKRFGNVVALDDVSIDLIAGEVHAIVGENGAGKSTLAKCLAGTVLPDSGTLVVDGRVRRFRGRRDSIECGIGFVPQALSLVGALTLTENLLLGRDRLAIDRTRAAADLTMAARRLGAELRFDVPAIRLSLAEQQLSEITLALAEGARVLLLDEPTSTLGPLEVERLIACVRELAQGGTAVGLVTHRVVEVMKGADMVTVLRAGRIVHQGRTSGLSVDAIARFMVGERSRAMASRRPHAQGPARLRAEGLSLAESGVPLLTGIDLVVHGGEIVGVAGLAGPSQAALAEALAGLRPPFAGRVFIDGTEVTGAAQRAAALGTAYVPDTRTVGLATDRTVAENGSVLRLREAAFRLFGLRRPAREAAHATSVCGRFDVRPPRPDLLAAGLSGGNQQKLMVGRELERTPAIIVVHGPTQGLDLAAAAAIRNELTAAAERGAAVLIISADLDEILGISSRIVVLAAGEIADRLDVEDGRVDMTRLGRAMAGAA